jgi:hypothetical protein
MAAAASTAGVPARIDQARHSSSPTVKNEMRPRRSYAARSRRSRARGAHRDGRDARLPGEPVETGTAEGAGEVGRVFLVGVEDHQQRLEGEKGEPLEEAPVRVAQLQRAQGGTGLERRAAAHERGAFAPQLGGAVLADLPLQAFEAVAGDGEVGEQQLGFDQLHVPTRVDVALGVGDRLGLEAANHDRYGVHGAQLGQVEALPPASGDGGNVDEPDRGRDLPARAVQRGQSVETFVRHRGHAHPRLPPARDGRVAGEEREQSALARQLQTDDAELHGDTPRAAHCNPEPRTLGVDWRLSPVMAKRVTVTAARRSPARGTAATGW